MPATGVSADPRLSSLHLRHGAHNSSDSAHEVRPVGVFPYQLLPACGGELVILRAPVVLGGLPRGRDPAFRFEALQRRIERAELNIESLIGGAANGFGDSIAVKPAGQERPEYEHVQRSLQQVHIKILYMKIILISMPDVLGEVRFG